MNKLTRLVFLCAAVMAVNSISAQAQDTPPVICGGPADNDDFHVAANAVSTCEVDPLLAEVGNTLGIVRDYNLVFGNVPRPVMTGNGGKWVDIEKDPAGQSVDITRYEYAPDWHIPALREDVTPASGDRVIRVVKGDRAWNEGPEPGLNPMDVTDPNVLALRKARLWLSPHGIVRAAAFAQKGLCPENDAINTEEVRKCPDHTVTINGTEGFSATIYGNKYDVKLGEEKGIKGYVASITVTVNNMEIVSNFSGYRNGEGMGDSDDAAIALIGVGTAEEIAAATTVMDEFRFGVYYPSQIVQTVNGKTTLDVNIVSGWTNRYVPFPDPELLRQAANK